MHTMCVVPSKMAWQICWAYHRLVLRVCRGNSLWGDARYGVLREQQSRAPRCLTRHLWNRGSGCASYAASQVEALLMVPECAARMYVQSVWYAAQLGSVPHSLTAFGTGGAATQVGSGSPWPGADPGQVEGPQGAESASLPWVPPVQAAQAAALQPSDEGAQRAPHPNSLRGHSGSRSPGLRGRMGRGGAEFTFSIQLHQFAAHPSSRCLAEGCRILQHTAMGGDAGRGSASRHPLLLKR